MSELKSQIKYRTSRNEAFTGVSYTLSVENIHIIQFDMCILIIREAIERFLKGYKFDNHLYSAYGRIHHYISNARNHPV